MWCLQYFNQSLAANEALYALPQVSIRLYIFRWELKVIRLDRFLWIEPERFFCLLRNLQMECIVKRKLNYW